MIRGGIEGFRQLRRHLVGDLHHVIIAAGVSTALWLIAYAFGRDPDIAEAGWVFFCVMGILFHRSNLWEVYRDREAVRRHPSSNEIDMSNLGDHIRGEWLRIVTKTLFLIAGFIALYMLPRINEFLDMLRTVSVMSIMAGLACLDIDAILDKISRRHLVSLIIADINARPLGLSTAERLTRAITIARDMFHDMNAQQAIIVAVMEHIQLTGSLPEGVEIGDVIVDLERIGSAIREAHALIKSYDPAAGGQSRQKIKPEG